MDKQNMNPCGPPKKVFSLWGVSYRVEGASPHKGVAVVKARDANHANQVFKANSAFNANQESIVIEVTAQIPDLTESGLCVECYIDAEGNTRINYGS